MIAGSLGYPCAYECGALWRHLTDAKLVTGEYGNDKSKPICGADGCGELGIPIGQSVSGPINAAVYMPAAKARNGYFGAGGFGWWSGGIGNIPPLAGQKNFFYVTGTPRALRFSWPEPSVTKREALSLDTKLDDGNLVKGNFMALLGDPYWNQDYGNGADDVNAIPIFLW